MSLDFAFFVLSIHCLSFVREEFKSVLKQVREQQGKLSNRSMDYIIQQMRDVINAKENTMTPTLPAVTSQQQLPVLSSSIAATISENSTPTGSVTGKTVPAVKKQVTEKVTVRTLPKKQVCMQI